MLLDSLIKARILRDGPLSVADYMQAALADPEHGYYMTRNPFGSQGDFITAPEISQIFGELIGAWLAGVWQQSGQPHCLLLELGPGRGTLMSDILRATKAVPGFHETLEIGLLEISPVLEAMQRKAVTHPKARWLRNLNELPSLPLFFVANEFFDALPVRQYAGGQERQIICENGRLRFVPDAPVTAERSEAGESIMALLARHIARFGGAGLAIDYGYAQGRQGDTLQAVRQHAKADPLEAPGEADLTTHVDFGALKRAAESEKVNVYGPVPQGMFLRRLGAELRATALCRNATPEQRITLLTGLERLMSPEQMGELFKVLGIGHPVLSTPDGF